MAMVLGVANSIEDEVNAEDRIFQRVLDLRLLTPMFGFESPTAPVDCELGVKIGSDRNDGKAK
jgi:hypothetical protein